MERFRTLRRIQVEPDPEPEDPTPPPPPPPPPANDADTSETPTSRGLFLGVTVHRRASVQRGCKGDYIGVPSDPYLSKLLSKQGDCNVLFADRVLKFTESGKMKRRIVVITEFALYLVDPEADVLKRRIALAAVDRLFLSNLSDNFLAVVVPTEYDCLMASTRKAQIVDVVVEAIRGTSQYELEVTLSNRFEYHASAEVIKEVEFEEVDGGMKTRILKKETP